MSVFERIGCRPIINASGKMTALGASAASDAVAQALADASQEYVDIDELLVNAGKVIAKATGAEDGCPATGAAGSIVIGIAGILTGTDLSKIEAVPNLEGIPTEIIIQKGHAVHFGASITQLIRIAGGVPVEVGQANHVEASHIEGAITDRTAALMYVKSHHAVQKGMQSIEVMREIAHRHGLPLLVDAAAEEDFGQYVRMGADLVACSGGKALGGPTSGFLCGRADLIAAARAQYKGVGRPMKVGKEAILGLCTALEEYGNLPSQAQAQKASMQALAEDLSTLPGITASVQQDEAGREIYRAFVHVDPAQAGMDAEELTHRLETGTPSVFTRNHYANTGGFMIDPRPLRPGQDKVIADAIRAVLSHPEKGATQ